MTIDLRAHQSLAKLVEHVFSCAPDAPTPLTYEDLAGQIGRLRTKGPSVGSPWARGMGRILGRLGHMLLGLQKAKGIRIPEIQSLVVNKAGPLQGFPDNGIEEFWTDYPKMGASAKADRTAVEYQRIARFGTRWNDVLESLGLPTVQTGIPLGSSRSGGESVHHLALKTFVRNNPAIVGAGAHWAAIMEYALPSLDVVDVLFRSAECCFAVEVKSRISTEDDHRRGIYQIVKYRAILAAMQQARHEDSRDEVRAVLVLEGSLTQKLRKLAGILDVHVIENFDHSLPPTS